MVTIGRWKKMSIFFELPYWSSLYVRYFLDVMHLEKKIFQCLIGTLLNIPGKSKDGLDARLDLELGPIMKGKHTFLPPTAYTLSRKEKLEFCKFIHDVKVSEGYSSNIQNLVSIKDLKLISLKSHDCHAICSKVIDPEKLHALQRQICGSSYMRWMYHFECYIKTLKGYVKNRTRPEGCIVERYIVEETLDFCIGYHEYGDFIGIPKSPYAKRTYGEGIIGNEILTISRSELEQAHFYVLHNADEVEPYVERHTEMLRKSNPSKNENWIFK
ncbi:hypothetical protein Lal_00017105 [Lupinus albus]|nr:hypothetical protein Lal_00017105 [Lupinus albus]